MKTHAFPIQFAKEAILREQFTTAIEVLKPLSQNKANPEAQFLHAYLHFWDDDLTRLDAIQQLETLAENGHAESNYILVLCPDLEAGYQFTLPENPKQFDYLQRAVDLGSIYALTDLVECHLTGIIENGDLYALRQQLLEAFEAIPSRKRYPKMNFFLGKMLIEGIGGDVDIEKGLRISGSSMRNANQHYVFTAVDFAIETLLKLKDSFPHSEEIANSLLEERDKLLPDYKPFWLSYLQDYCRRTLIYDLHDISFDAYCDFVFDHFANLHHDFKSKTWADYAEAHFDPTQLLHFYTELFQDPSFLLERYTSDQIIQGLDMGKGGIRGRYDWTIGCAMSHPDTTADDIIACCRAMVGLFKHLFFRGAGLYDIGFMWWDIGYGGCGHETIRDRKSKYSDEDRIRVIHSSLLTMIDVLNMNSYYAQRAAIHGLGHFGSDESKAVLQQYLDDNPDLPASLREYALSAIKGEIM